MYISLIFVHLIIKEVYSNDQNQFIIDYFLLKQVPNVVGFSCNCKQNDLYLVKKLNEVGIKVLIEKVTEVSRIHMLAKTSYWKLGIFFDTRCYDDNGTISIFSEASRYYMFDELRYWLIIGDNLSHVLRHIDERGFGISMDFVIAVNPSNTQSDGYELYDAYNISKERGGKLNITFFGFWNKRNKITVVLTETKLRRRSNLHKITLKGIFYASNYKPQNVSLEDFYQDYSSSTKENLSKFGFIVLKHLSEFYNFRLQSIQAAPWQVGDRIGPIVRSLNYTLVDFAGSTVTMTLPRTYLIKYFYPVWPFRTCFIFRNPQPKEIKVNEIIRPLDNQVWYLIGVLSLLSMMILSFITGCGSHGSNMRFSNSFLLTIGALCQQGTDIKLKYVSARVAFFFILLFSVLIYDYYSASVVSARLLDPIFKINDSVPEMSRLHLKMSSEWMVYFDFLLKRPDKDSQNFLKNVWNHIPESERFMPPEKGMKLVQKGGFAYHTHPDVVYPLIDRYYDNREICELMEVNFNKPTFAYVAGTFNSTFVEMARVGLQKIAETGLRKRQILRWSYRKPLCRTDILSSSSITINEFAPHLILLMIGAIFAMFVYLMEVLNTRCYST